MDLPLGWVDFDQRTDEQNETHEAIVARMPAFGLVGETPPVGTKVLLTDTWKHQRVREAIGMDFPGIHQLTGSCVGAGGGNGCQTLNFLDTVVLNQAEKIVMIFWLYNYGRSRQLGGMRGRGEGSFGSTFAQSIAEDGALDARIPELNLPQPKNADQLVWSSSIEMEWSDGNRAPAEVRSEAKPHKFTSAQLGSGEQVRDSIVNGYPVLRAFNTYVNPGSARVRNGALIGSYSGRGGHQESWLGYWNHPQEGELIYEMNQWGAKAYGTDPGGGAPGGCWIRIEEVDQQCRGRYSEIYALSQYDGYPAQPAVYDWASQSFFS